MKRILEKILQGTTNHFSWFLPGRLGRLTVFFLKFLFSGVRLETEQAAVFEHLPPDAVVVLITKHKSRLERLFFSPAGRVRRYPARRSVSASGISFASP